MIVTTVYLLYFFIIIFSFSFIYFIFIFTYPKSVGVMVLFQSSLLSISCRCGLEGLSFLLSRHSFFIFFPSCLSISSSLLVCHFSLFFPILNFYQCVPVPHSPFSRSFFLDTNKNRGLHTSGNGDRAHCTDRWTDKSRHFLPAVWAEEGN